MSQLFVRLAGKKDEIPWPEHVVTTAHAGPGAAVVVTTRRKQTGCQVQMATLITKTNTHLIEAEQICKAVSLKQEEEEEESFYAEAKRLGNLSAFGRETNFSELAEERINYSVGADSVSFHEEDVYLGPNRKVRMPAELRGYREVKNLRAPRGEVLEPLTCEEALETIYKVKPEKEDVSLATARRSIDSWLRPNLEGVLDFLDNVIEQLSSIASYSLSLSTTLDYYKLDLEEYRRAKASVARDNIGGSWCWESWHGIGEREGITTEQARQNDISFKRLDQEHCPGERVDGKLLFGEELERSRQMNLFSQMFYRGGEKKPNNQVARPGENRSWAEKNLYMFRCSQLSDEVFADKLWKVLTWPIDWAEKGMEQLRQQYKQSVKENAPGPRRQRVGGRWQPAPLTGMGAIDWMKKSGRGTMAGKRVKKNVRLFKGQTWHKLMLSRKHMDGLEEALLWRKGVIKLNVAGQVVEERFHQPYQGLSPDQAKSLIRK